MRTKTARKKEEYSGRLDGIARRLARMSWSDLLDIPATMLVTKLEFDLRDSDCVRVLFLAIQYKRDEMGYRAEVSVRG